MQTAATSQPSFPELDPESVRLRLRAILNSKTLSRASFLSSLLNTCVEQTLAGNSDELKELWLGRVVFQRTLKFNPAKDPIVRVQARRLRQKLLQYYRTEGLLDSIRITLPVGSYVPVFSIRNLEQPINCVGNRCSVAVLPLTTLDADSSSVRFANSMTAELTHALVSAGGLEVVSRTSASAFKDAAQDIRAIGSALNADFIVEGCTRLEGTQHRIILQLTATETGYHCWAAWFEQRGTGSVPNARNVAEILRQEILASGIAQTPQGYKTSAKPRFM